ncbi:AMP-binding protein [Xanthobacter autotrophicus]|uniref:AMP-binding protein n=1 Tax=Xanthobacter autotrophicus TaxID=280 RepID=UPI00372779DA
MDWRGITIGQALRATARRVPGRTAVVGMGERISFARLDAEVDRLAAGLLSLGVRRGDTVALWMTNCPTWVAIWAAVARIGAVLVPVNTRFKAEEAHYVLTQSEAKILLMMDRYWSIDYLDMLERIAPGFRGQHPGTLQLVDLPALRSVVVWNDRAPPGTLALADLRALGEAKGGLAEAEAVVEADDPVIIVYTSGTTGYPKGAVHSHVVLRNSANIARVLHIEAGDVLLGHMPFYHVAGAFSALLPALMLGGTLITMAHWEPDEALRLVEEERITYISGIPTHFIDLVDAIRRRPRDTSCLKSAWIGGAAVTPEVVRAALDQLKLDSLQAVYGMTETTSSTVLSGFDAPLEIVCDNKGKPIGDFEVKVCDPKTGVARPAGEVGEVWVRGHIVMQGYYKNPDATNEVMTSDGWFKTGDLGVFDMAGYLKITGRAKEMFIVGGSNTYPAEIERMIQAHPAVKQAVVVGVPDRRLGEVGYAFVELQVGQTMSAADLISHCRSSMADYKVPRYVEFISDFPRTTTGKLQRYVLAERARGMQQSAVS